MTKSTFQYYLNKLEVILNRLRQKVLKVNVAKSTFLATQIEYLGYLITIDGIKPLQQQKTQAILQLEKPTTLRELRRMLGMVQYYRDIWKKT